MSEKGEKIKKEAFNSTEGISPVSPPVKKSQSAKEIQESIISFCEEKSHGLLVKTQKRT